LIEMEMDYAFIIYGARGREVVQEGSYTELTELMVQLEFNMEAKAKPLTIVAFFAHPDDETMFLGGTLAYLADQGAVVHYLSATRGEGGEMGDPPICARSELGQVREKELICAVDALGGTSLDFLGFQDPVVGPEGELFPFSEDLGQVIEKFSGFLTRIQPDVILTHGPGGEYGHPAHIQTHRATMEALRVLDYSPLAVYSPAWLSRETGEFTPAPGILVDIGPWVSVKIKAVNCHRSQHGLFLRHGASRAGRPVTIPEMVRSQEALCRIRPDQGLGGDPFEELLGPITRPVHDQA
jgi:LmbE family N-acetylglucosaminyl deacetylase